MRPFAYVLVAVALTIVTSSPAWSAEPRAQNANTVILVRVEAPPDLQPGYAKQILQQELARYGYSVLGCLDDLVDQNEMLRIFRERGIKSSSDAPRYTDLLKHMTETACASVSDRTLFATRIIAENDQGANHRSVVVLLKHLPPSEGTNAMRSEDVLLQGTAKAAADTGYDELIRRAVDDALAPKPPPPTRPNKRRVAGLATLAVGVAGMVAGAVTGVILLAKKSDLDGGDCANSACGPSQYGGVDSYNRLRIVSATAFIVGAAGLVGGTVLLKVSRWGGPDVQVAIAPSPTGGSAAVVGRF